MNNNTRKSHSIFPIYENVTISEERLSSENRPLETLLNVCKPEDVEKSKNELPQEAAGRSLLNSVTIGRLYKSAIYDPRLQEVCIQMIFTSEFMKQDLSKLEDADDLVRHFIQFKLRTIMANPGPYHLPAYIKFIKWRMAQGRYFISFKQYLIYMELIKSHMAQGGCSQSFQEYLSDYNRLSSWASQISLALQQETLDQVLDAYMAIDPIDRLDEALQQKLAVDSATAAAQTAAEFAATCAGSASVESEASASSGSEDSSSEDSDVEDTALNTHTVSTLLASQDSIFDANITTADSVESEASEFSESESSDSDEDSESNVSASEGSESKASASDEGPDEHEDLELGGITASKQSVIMSPVPGAKNKQKSPLAPDELWRNRFDSSAPEPMSPMPMISRR